MTLVPMFRSTDIARSVAFYTKMLDFTHHDTWPDSGDPAYAILLREDDELHLSSHGGDGKLGHAVVVLIDGADALWRTFAARGIDQSHRDELPVHLGPTEQSWGTRDFYIDDPDGNTPRFIQR